MWRRDERAEGRRRKRGGRIGLGVQVRARVRNVRVRVREVRVRVRNVRVLFFFSCLCFFSPLGGGSVMEPISSWRTSCFLFLFLYVVLYFTLFRVTYRLFLVVVLLFLLFLCSLFGFIAAEEGSGSVVVATKC